MKEKKTIRNLAAALGAFVLWGNIVSLLLPAAEYGAVVKTVDFATSLFLLAILVTAGIAALRERETGAEKKRDDRADGKSVL